LQPTRREVRARDDRRHQLPRLCSPGVPPLRSRSTARDDRHRPGISSRSTDLARSGYQVKQLSDSIVAKLQTEMQVPDLNGTRYRVVRHLARGGMASVWLAED